MTNVQVYKSEIGIPLVMLSGLVNESSGAELADKVMRHIRLATEDPAEFPHPLSLDAPCTRAPETSARGPAGG